MRTLVVQGDWLLRKMHYKNLKMTMYHGPERLYCGGFVAFIDTVRKAISDHLIDKVVVVWDGMFDGWTKYDRAPILRTKKEKLWNQRMRIQGRPHDLSEKEEHEFQILQQKVKLQKHFGELNIRQLTEKESESIDAIGLYVKEAVAVGEEIILLSRDHEFFQVLGEHVSILQYDGVKITSRNFYEMHGYSHTNDLMIKCFTGMPAGVVNGIKNLTLRMMLIHFSGLKLDHYPYADMMEFARRKRVDVRRKIYDTVLGASEIVHRNAKLINMQNPHINTDLSIQTNYCLYSPLNEGRLDELVERYERENYKAHIHGDFATYFEPFQRVLLKEKEYKLFHEQVNI